MPIVKIFLLGNPNLPAARRAKRWWYVFATPGIAIIHRKSGNFLSVSIIEITILLSPELVEGIHYVAARLVPLRSKNKILFPTKHFKCGLQAILELREFRVNARERVSCFFAPVAKRNQSFQKIGVAFHFLDGDVRMYGNNFIFKLKNNALRRFPANARSAREQVWPIFFYCCRQLAKFCYFHNRERGLRPHARYGNQKLKKVELFGRVKSIELDPIFAHVEQ